jgi:3-hydroxyisobutyrate dehydrogenase-like beta-hydroxyacid dehydrogenase
MRLGIVGVGLLGTAVAGRLLEAGFDVVGYDVRPERVEALRGRGLGAARSVAGAAAGADAVFTVLPSEQSVEDAIRGPQGLLEAAPPGITICQMSTVSPALVSALGEAAARAGLTLLDTPISGTSAVVARGEATVFVGGDEDRFRALRPVFDAIAATTVHLGDVGTAAVAKLAANLVSGVTATAIAEALVLGAKAGLKPARLLEALAHSSADSRVLRNRGAAMVEHRFEPQSRLDIFLKDFRLMLAEGQRVGAPLPLTSTAHLLCQATSATGHGGEDLAAVITTLELLAGLGGTPPARHDSIESD